jgi:Protein of unknown function (DUF742)
MRHSVCRSVVNVAPRGHGPARRAGRRVATEGHTRDLPLESVVTATQRESRGLGPEHRAVVELARRPVSLGESGAALTVPLAVVRGLVGHLDERGFLDVHVPPAFAGGRPTGDVLARLLDGLRAR